MVQQGSPQVTNGEVHPERREAMETIRQLIWKAMTCSYKNALEHPGEGLINFYTPNSFMEELMTKRYSSGNPMIAVLADDQTLPVAEDEFNNLNTKHPEYRNAVNDMLMAGWRKLAK